MYKIGQVFLDEGNNSMKKKGRKAKKYKGALYRWSIDSGKDIGNKAANGSWRGRHKRMELTCFGAQCE